MNYQPNSRDGRPQTAGADGRPQTADGSRNIMPPRKAPNTETYAGRFAVRLRTLRKKAGLSPQEVADFLEISDVSYYALEKGTPTIRLDYLPQIADALGVKIRTLLPEK